MKLSPCLTLGRLFPFRLFLILLLALGMATGSRAALSASATFSDTGPVAGVYTYTLTLNNTGTTTIGTFWFGWIPGQDYMATSPTNIISPTNWTSTITGGGGSDGYAIRWVASSSANYVASGTSQTFSFSSTDTPAAMAGDSTFYPSTPVGTSFVYIAGPFSDPGFEFVVTPQATPEPSALALLVVGALGLSFMRWRRSVSVV